MLLHTLFSYPNMFTLSHHFILRGAEGGRATVLSSVANPTRADPPSTRAAPCRRRVRLTEIDARYRIVGVHVHKVLVHLPELERRRHDRRVKLDLGRPRPN